MKKSDEILAHIIVSLVGAALSAYRTIKHMTTSSFQITSLSLILQGAITVALKPALKECRSDRFQMASFLRQKNTPSG
jgi:hypothetical protein